eukprot:gene5204-6480_t
MQQHQIPPPPSSTNSHHQISSPPPQSSSTTSSSSSIPPHHIRYYTPQEDGVFFRPGPEYSPLSLTSGGGGGYQPSVFPPPLPISSPSLPSSHHAYALHIQNREKEFFSLKKDVYSFVLNHWDLLCPKKSRSFKWKKQIQDALSHSKVFKSGIQKLGCNGFWKLKSLTSPWSNSKPEELDDEPLSSDKEDLLDEVSLKRQLELEDSGNSIGGDQSEESLLKKPRLTIEAPPKDVDTMEVSSPNLISPQSSCVPSTPQFTSGQPNSSVPTTPFVLSQQQKSIINNNNNVNSTTTTTNTNTNNSTKSKFSNTETSNVNSLVKSSSTDEIKSMHQQILQQKQLIQQQATELQHHQKNQANFNQVFIDQTCQKLQYLWDTVETLKEQIEEIQENKKHVDDAFKKYQDHITSLTDSTQMKLNVHPSLSTSVGSISSDNNTNTNTNNNNKMSTSERINAFFELKNGMLSPPLSSMPLGRGGGISCAPTSSSSNMLMMSTTSFSSPPTSYSASSSTNTTPSLTYSSTSIPTPNFGEWKDSLQSLVSSTKPDLTNFNFKSSCKIGGPQLSITTPTSNTLMPSILKLSGGGSNHHDGIPSGKLEYITKSINNNDQSSTSTTSIAALKKSVAASMSSSSSSTSADQSIDNQKSQQLKFILNCTY